MRSLVLFVCLLAAGCGTLRVPPTAYVPTQWDVENLFREVNRWSYAINACRNELSFMEQMSLERLFSPVQEAAWNLELAWNRNSNTGASAQRLNSAIREFETWTTIAPYGNCRLHLNEENF